MYIFEENVKVVYDVIYFATFIYQVKKFYLKLRYADDAICRISRKITLSHLNSLFKKKLLNLVTHNNIKFHIM